MKKNYAHKVIVHISDDTDIHALSRKVSEFHIDVIERKLNQTNLTTEQKITVIDKILGNLKSREVNGIIK